MSEYGEPLEIKGDGRQLFRKDGMVADCACQWANDDDEFGLADDEDRNAWYARRFRDCLNACSGMPDPASEIEAMRRVITTSKQFHAAVYYWFEGMNEGVSDHEMQVRKAALGVIEDQYHAALSEYHKIKGGTDGKIEAR